MKREIKLKIERLNELYCGVDTGNIVYHASEAGCGNGTFVGCPLGRGWSEEVAVADFVSRANADDKSLKLKVSEITITKRADHANKTK